MVQKIQTGEGKIEKVQKVKKDSKNVQKMIVTNTKIGSAQTSVICYLKASTLITSSIASNYKRLQAIARAH